MAYAQALTKRELINLNFEDIKDDGTVIRKGSQVPIRVTPNKTTGPYLSVVIWDSIQKKERTLGLHRLIYVWNVGDIPDGYVVDHVNNRHSALEDYKIANLQLLTVQENLAKNKRPSTSTYKIRMAKRGYTRWEILDKIQYYTEKIVVAKSRKDYEGWHKLRTSLAQWKNRLRQYDSNPDLYKKTKLGAPNSAEEMKEAKRLFINAKRNYLIDPSEENFREYTFLGSRYETMKTENRNYRRQKQNESKSV